MSRKLQDAACTAINVVGVTVMLVLFGAIVIEALAIAWLGVSNTLAMLRHG